VGREGRLGARLAALAFERLEQSGLLTADVSAGAAMHNDRDADETGSFGFGERRHEDLVLA